MVKFLRKLSDKGASLTEYALLVSLIAVICLVAVSATGGNIQALMGTTSMATSNLTVYGEAPLPPGPGIAEIPVVFTVGSTLTAQIAAPSEIPFTAECKGDGGDKGKRTEPFSSETGIERIINVPITPDTGQTYVCTVNGVVMDGTGGGGLASGNTVVISGLTLTPGATDVTATFIATPAAVNGYTLTCDDGVSNPTTTGATTTITLTGLTPGNTYGCSVTAIAPDISSAGTPVSVTIPVAGPTVLNFDDTIDGQSVNGYSAGPYTITGSTFTFTGQKILTPSQQWMMIDAGEPITSIQMDVLYGKISGTQWSLTDVRLHNGTQTNTLGATDVLFAYVTKYSTNPTKLSWQFTGASGNSFAEPTTGVNLTENTWYTLKIGVTQSGMTYRVEPQGGGAAIYSTFIANTRYNAANLTKVSFAMQPNQGIDNIAIN